MSVTGNIFTKDEPLVVVSVTKELGSACTVSLIVINCLGCAVQ